VQLVVTSDDKCDSRVLAAADVGSEGVGEMSTRNTPEAP
jgi:hypothetical protein